MSDRAIKLAVIGLGMASKPHLAALKQLSPGVQVEGLYARSLERRSKASAEWGWRSFESIDEIARSDVDGAILVTPPNARSEIIEVLAGAGKSILTEKPVERDLQSARMIVDTCERAGVALGVVFQHRFRAGAEALTKLVNDGSLGSLQLVRVSVPWWRDQSYYDQSGRGTYAVDGGGVLITQAIHLLDLMLSLAGPVVEVVALSGTTDLHEMEAEDFATAGLRFANGALGSVVATTAAFPGSAESLSMDFENASVRLIAGELTIHWRDGRTETVGEVTGSGGGSDPMDFPCDWHRDLISDFAEAIRSGRSPRITGREALRVHALIDAVRRSSDTGAVAKVETHT